MLHFVGVDTFTLFEYFFFQIFQKKTLNKSKCMTMT